MTRHFVDNIDIDKLKEIIDQGIEEVSGKIFPPEEIATWIGELNGHPVLLTVVRRQSAIEDMDYEGVEEQSDCIQALKQLG